MAMMEYPAKMDPRAKMQRERQSLENSVLTARPGKPDPAVLQDRKER